MTEQLLPPLANRDTIQERLRVIFPEGTPNRPYCVRKMAASTVFAMLYVGAVEGAIRFLAPKQIYRMTETQSRRTGDRDRLRYAVESLRPGFSPKGRRWYLDNTREPIRDETLRDGLIAVGATVVRAGVPTTSSLPRYALKASFAALFDPRLVGTVFEEAANEWRRANLSPSALARVALVTRGVVSSREGVLVTFPNGETRRMAAGPSSAIAKAIVEVFAPKFLGRPGVVLLSESQAKIINRDEELISRLGLRIEPGGNLPDILLVDLGPPEPLLVFVEVVATDGAVTAERKEALLRIATDAGFRHEQVAFVTAYT
ncbi:MAG: BsuBI/PstI family type II restriction endonuclease, partial [bacterium]